MVLPGMASVKDVSVVFMHGIKPARRVYGVVGFWLPSFAFLVVIYLYTVVDSRDREKVEFKRIRLYF